MSSTKAPTKTQTIDEIVTSVRAKIKRNDDNEIKPEELELRLIYQPTEEEPDVEIVAVHGIGAVPSRTWHYETDGANWLCDATMLPAAISTARIMVFNYRSSWLGESALRQSINSAAGSMLQSLMEDREECSQRPLLFVGHCFGGLITQRGYNEAMQTKSDYPGLAEAISGIVFLATPHHGPEDRAGFQKQGGIYALIAGAEVEIQENVSNL